MKETNNNYENMEEVATNVVKVLLKENVPYEDIMHLTGKSKEEINKIKELEKIEE